MRKTKIIFFVVFLSLLTGCKKKSQEVSAPNTPSKSDKELSKVIPRPSPEVNQIESQFELKEIPVEQNSVEVPKVVSEVNQDIKKIIQSSERPASEVWKKYFRIAITDNELNAILDDRDIWQQLADKLNTGKMPSIMYEETEDQSSVGKRGLYGLYLASVLSSSNGGEELYALMKERASDPAAKNIDLEIYKTVVAGITDVDNRPSKLYLEEWEQFSESTNPVYKMLAIQLGRFLTNKQASFSTTEERNQELGRYYDSFLKDQSQEIRLEALRAIQNLGEEVSLPIVETYRRTNFGAEDKAALDSMF